MQQIGATLNSTPVPTLLSLVLYVHFVRSNVHLMDHLLYSFYSELSYEQFLMLFYFFQVKFSLMLSEALIM